MTKEWQEAFNQSWVAFQNGSIPIGAIITDEAGDIIVTGRNETCEGRIPNRRTAHAEMDCVRNLDITKYSDFGKYHLYTTMEPCPMCMGTIVMGGIRKIHVAAKDKYCGAIHYLEYDSYMKSKEMKVYMEEALQAVQLAQQGYHELRRFNGEISTVLEQFQKECPKAIEVAIQMFRERFLDKCVENNVPYCEIFDDICQRLGI